MIFCACQVFSFVIFCACQRQNFFIGWYSTRPINTRPKMRENIMLPIIILMSHLRVFSLHYFVKLPPLCNRGGSHGRHSSSFPTTVRANRVKLHVTCSGFVLKFPSLASTCVELVSMQPTKHSIIRGALSAVNLYTDVFVSGFDMDRYEHTRHTC